MEALQIEVNKFTGSPIGPASLKLLGKCGWSLVGCRTVGQSLIDKDPRYVGGLTYIFEKVPTDDQ